MDQSPLVDRSSYIVAGVIFVITFLLFFKDTGEFAKCIGAALITAALTWISYIVIRWLVLAINSKSS